ncbi:MAG: hypothetical protein QOK15_1397, partial [Nocardioidaceae bacterium]|nr:hypothetical protein [Nocardioidaceae bacterium]
MTSTTTTTSTVTSADGTRIAYESSGTGPVLVLVDGAMCFRGMGPSRDLTEHLRDRFTVVSYDRRGRGGSGAGSSPWSLERELDDLAAVLEATGGRASLLGVSSGAVLVLEAARRGLPVERVVGYEAPFILDDSQAPTDPGFPEHVQRLVDEGRRSEAVRAFFRLVGVPTVVRGVMRVLPVWSRLTSIAHTLPYDLALTVPRQQGR